MTKRLTIPEGQIAVLLDDDLAAELRSLCKQLRNSGKRLEVEQGHRDIASDLLLAIIDGEDRRVK